MRPFALALILALPICAREGEPVHPCRGGTDTQPLACSASDDLPGGGVGSHACRAWSTRCYADGGLTLSTRQTLCGFACEDECAAGGLDCARDCYARRRCADGP